MNELITLDGLCIKSVDYGETDAIINVYATGRGKISAKVRGARGAKKFAPAEKCLKSGRTGYYFISTNAL